MEASFWTSLTLGISVLFLLAELYRRRYLSFRDGVPTLVSIPFIRQVPISRLGDSHDYHKETIRELGSPVLRIYNIFKPWSRSVLVADPAVLREVFAGPLWEAFDRSHPYAEILRRHAGGLILMPNGQKWREAREHLGTKTFAAPAIRSYLPVMREQFAVFLDRVEKERAANGGKVELQALFNNLTFDVVCRLVFGEAVAAQTTEEGKRYLKAWDGVLGLSQLLSALQATFARPIWSLFPKIVKQYESDMDAINQLVLRNVARRKRGEDPDRVSILDDFFRSAKVPDWLKEDDEIVRQLVTLLFAGHDTTAALLSFMAHELSVNTDWQSKLRAEVLDAFGPATGAGELITNLEKLEAMPILNACLKETLRLYPSAPYGGGRVMNRDLVYEYTDTATGKPATIEFRKGDQVLPFVYGAQTDPRFWKSNPDKWDPSRFLDDPNGGAVNFFAYAPFGNGARRCAGERLALAEGRMATAELVRRYEWKPDVGTFKVLFTGTLKAKDGVRVVLTPIKA
ncbi:cytochrome P450 [Hyaloraphidium curvatum]|nr:cytochrome P450 [Hyaloraphidium curvatum]